MLVKYISGFSNVYRLFLMLRIFYAILDLVA